MAINKTSDTKNHGSESALIDAQGYRHNVGMLIFNGYGDLFWAKRNGLEAWQFPQGGINVNETTEAALERELYEEVGLISTDVKIVAETKDWISYTLPEKLRRIPGKPFCVGQKQKWFLLELVADDHTIDLNQQFPAEFECWAWAKYWYPIKQVVYFKQAVYRAILKELSPMLCQYLTNN